jgi:hypothetical protein
MAIQLTPRRFSAAEYRQMIEAGVFGRDERLELIDGEIVQLSPIGDRHAACVRRLIALLSELFATQAIVDTQNPIMVDVAFARSPIWRCCAREPTTTRRRHRTRPIACLSLRWRTRQSSLTGRSRRHATPAVASPSYGWSTWSAT